MIVTYPNDILGKKSRPVSTEDISNSKIKNLIKEMRAEITKLDGIGLAAVQIGDLKRIILVLVDGEYKVFINPKIIRKSWKKIAIEEACLSVPGQSGYVKRHQNVTIQALDENGSATKEKYSDLPAIIFQHEIDHLDGILFIDRICPV